MHAQQPHPLHHLSNACMNTAAMLCEHNRHLAVVASEENTPKAAGTNDLVFGQRLWFDLKHAARPNAISTHSKRSYAHGMTSASSGT
eukprot:m.1340633 g.1340633  ORF g.1340633 m.1340633 type:complete len:87 (-) comp24890_c1_seq27:810-1070(-)